MALGPFETVEQRGGASASFAVQPSGYVLSKLLAANVAKTFVVPPGAKAVSFSATMDFFATFDGTTAAVPGDVTDGSAACLNPSMRAVTKVASISVITPDSGVITAEFWS